MPTREFLYIVQESAYGTAVASPTLGTNAIYVRLDENNPFTTTGDPIMYDISHGGGIAENAVTGSDQFECTGTLNTQLYGSQAVFLSNWFGQPIDAGQTSPWTTTEPPGDLASCSVYHGVAYDTGAINRIRYAGSKVESWKVSCSRDSKIATLSLNIRSQRPVGNAYDSSVDPTSTEFPAPAETNYPTDVFRFIDLAGNVTIGSGRTQFLDVEINGANNMDPEWYEGRFLSLHRYFGRNVTADVNLKYKPSPDDITAYWGLTAQATSIGFNNGTHSLIFNMNSQTFIRKVTKQLQSGKVYNLPLNLRANFDPAAGQSLSITAT